MSLQFLNPSRMFSTLLPNLDRKLDFFLGLEKPLGLVLFESMVEDGSRCCGGIVPEQSTVLLRNFQIVTKPHHQALRSGTSPQL